MKLTTKLVYILILGTVVIATIHGILAIRSENRRFEEDLRQEALRLGTALDEMILVTWKSAGPDGVLRLLRNLESKESNLHMHIRWVWFDAREGDPYRPLVPLEVLGDPRYGRLHIIPISGTAGAEHMFAYWPIEVGVDRAGGLEFSKSLEPLRQAQSAEIVRTISRILSSLALTGGLAILLGIFMVGRPLDALIQKTRRMAQGDLASPIDLRSRDELSELANSLNQLCVELQQSKQRILEESNQRVEVLEQLRHADRLRTVGRLASGVAHELGTPLNVVAGRAAMIAQGRLQGEDVIQSAQVIRHEAQRMTRLIQSLLDLARQKSLQRSQTDLWHIIRQTETVVSPIAKKHHVDFRYPDQRTPCIVQVDPAQMQQVFTNLFMNAVQSMPEGGAIDVEVLPSEPWNPSNGQQVSCFEVRVRDQGVGIPNHVLDQVFEPFFTTKDVGEGTGLGLSIAYGIVQEHGGWIDVSSQPGQGSCFVVYLPRANQAVAQPTS